MSKITVIPFPWYATLKGTNGRKGFNPEYINFGGFCLNEMNMQAQSGMYVFEGLHHYPPLGYHLRIIGDMENYHSVLIHKEDALKFKARYEAYIKRINSVGRNTDGGKK